MFRSGILLTAGNIGVALLSLARNVLVARLISVEDFGIAATFAITMALVEMFSNLGLDRLLVQAPEGEGRRFGSALQGLQLARGLIAAVVLYLLAYPYAAFLGVPEIAWAYELMALVPLMRGALHLDMFRLQRRMRFRPFVTVEFAAQTAALLVVAPLVWQFGDWRAMLGSILIHQTTLVVLSHLVAERRWRLAWSRVVLGRAISFGLPLLATNALLFGIFQGDRLIVGNRLGLEALGLFSVAFMLTLMPTTVLAKSLQGVLLPKLSRLDDGPAFEVLARATMEAALAIGTGLAIVFALVGPPLLVLLFGAKYAPVLELLIWLSIMQAVRVAKAGPAIVAIARAETTNPMMANLVRIAALPVVFLALSVGGGLMAVAWIALVGEALALAVAALRLRSRLGLSLSGLGLSYGAAAGLLGLIGLDAAMIPPAADLTHFHAEQLGLALAFVGFLSLALPNLRRLLIAKIRR